MKSFSLAVALILTSYFIAGAQTMNPKELAAEWEAKHVSRIAPSNVRHRDLKVYLEELKQIGMKVDEVGRSFGDREIYQIEWGVGPTKVFLWSQMHGDEPTATSAMIDLLAYLQRNPTQDWVKNLHESLSIRFVPMLNPDGAEFYQRRNLQGIDINRDAAGLKTPEGQLLKRLRDDWKPEIGFNLHNQGPLTTAGKSPTQASISFLAVLGDPNGASNPAFERNKRIIASMVSALDGFIPGNIARYDDSFNALAFGDNFSAWGTPVILIETGGLHGRDEFYLVKMNFVAIATALQVIADRSDAKYDASAYEHLPMNDSGILMDVVFRHANIVSGDSPDRVFIADIGVNRERRRAEFSSPTYIRDIGTLSANVGLMEYDVSDYFVVHRFKKVNTGESGELLFYNKSRKIDWQTPQLEFTVKPDAIYSLGEWTVGAKLMEKALIEMKAPK